MKFIKYENWNLEKVSPGVLFFIQRIDELLFHYTIDSFKPMALNTPYLCIECIRTINHINEGHIDKKNIEHILEELQERLRNDFIAKELIHTKAEYFTDYSDQITLNDLKSRLEVLERCLDGYRYYNQIFLTLKNNIINESKDKIDYIAKCLITTLINWGVSKNFLYVKFQKLFFGNNNKVEDDNIIDIFQEAILPKDHHFTVYIKASRQTLLFSDAFKYFSMQEITSPSESIMAYLDKIYFTRKDGIILLEIKNIRSPDHYMARDMAERRLETLKNTSQLFTHQNRIFWSQKAIVIQQCCKEDIYICKKKINPMLLAENQTWRNVAEKTCAIFQKTNLNKVSIRKLNRGIEIHSKTIKKQTTDSQLVNLWTIFETIVPPNSKISKVQNIINTITPIILRKYIPKITSTIIKDLMRWNKTFFFSLLQGIEEEGSDIAKFIHLICKNEYLHKKESLYNELAHYHLLRNRAFHLSELYLSKEKMEKQITKHEKNLQWQLRRIYRTRNLIVHAGETPSYISTLIENAHCYIDQVFNEIMSHSISNYRVQTLSQSFNISKLLYKEMQEKIKTSINYSQLIDAHFSNQKDY